MIHLTAIYAYGLIGAGVAHAGPKPEEATIDPSNSSIEVATNIFEQEDTLVLVPGSYVTLYNGEWAFNTTPVPSLLRPAAGEQGHHTAMRFEYSKELWVQGLRFPVSIEDTCANTPPILHLYAGPGTTPPAEPDILLSVPLPNTIPNTYGVHWVEVNIESSVIIPAEENLFVDVEYVGALNETVCLLSTAQELPDPVETDYWSDSATAPYPWVGLDSYGFEGKNVMAVHAFVPL